MDTENGTFDTIDIKNDESSNNSCREDDSDSILQSQQQPQNIVDNQANNGNGFLEEEGDEEIFRSSISNSTMSEVTVSSSKVIKFMGGGRHPGQRIILISMDCSPCKQKNIARRKQIFFCISETNVINESRGCSY